MKNVLTFAAVAEAATGLALLIVPSLVVHLLLGEQLTGVAIPVARVAGIALIALAIACWPGPPLIGMLTYSALITLYLAYLGFRRFDRRPSVAGGSVSRSSDSPSRSRLARRPRGEIMEQPIFPSGRDLDCWMSESGTKLPIRDVRYPVANRGRPDMVPTAQFGRD